MATELLAIVGVAVVVWLVWSFGPGRNLAHARQSERETRDIKKWG